MRWRDPARCGDCEEFHPGEGTMLSGLPRPGWCGQCRGPVRPEAPACPVFAERAPEAPKRAGGPSTPTVEE